MPEPDPIAELLARVAREHHWVATYCQFGPTQKCSCGALVDRQRDHQHQEMAAALRDAGHVYDGAEVEWAVVDRGRTIHIEGATCPADVLAGAHGHGATQVGVARRTVTRTPWQPINHGQENP